MVVNRHHKGLFDVYIGRGRAGNIPEPPEYGCWGNPFSSGSRENNIQNYRLYLEDKLKNPQWRLHFLTLRGNILSCWCKPQACHGDVMEEYLEKLHE